MLPSSEVSLLSDVCRASERTNAFCQVDNSLLILHPANLGNQTLGCEVTVRRGQLLEVHLAAFVY